MDILVGFWPAVGLIVGLAAGVLAAMGWTLILRPGVQGRFWMNLGAVALGLWRVDELGQFLGLYRRLLGLLGGYLARNIGAMALSIAALLAGLFIAIAPLEARRAATPLFAVNRDQAALKVQDGVAHIKVGDFLYSASVDEGPVKVAICWTSLGCALPQLMEFQTVRAPPPQTKISEPVLLRSGPSGLNPLWPWVSDLEAVYLAAFILAMSAWMLLAGRRRPAEADPMISHGDFALLQANEQLGFLVRWVGRLEDARLGASALQAPLQAPVFITGLARSGTTVLLNALTKAKDVGTHQYSDFPFLAAPITWHAIQGMMSREEKAVERPHRDRIKITKLSPEAFEEPIWQHYFEQAHDPKAVQALTARTSNPKFEAFFHGHLQKILRLRGASRYVSKGNYNIGRLAYLAKLYPDARFIVPIRAPLDHVASLVRQHELFCAYAKDDPRVPQYMESAGHYEFGPQRRAICLRSEDVGQVDAAWEMHGDAAGYAQQWAQVYGYLAELLAEDADLAARVKVVRYEDLCAEPERTLIEILEHAGLSDEDGQVLGFATTLSLSDAPIPPHVQAQAERVARLTEAVARDFGYAP